MEKVNKLEEVELLIKGTIEEMEEIEEIYGDDFNPMDASGGNFDDCYELGREHGEVEGRLTGYSKALLIARELSEMQDKLMTAESLLSEAQNMLDNVHCYDTDLYREISAYLYGESEEEE